MLNKAAALFLLRRRDIHNKSSHLATSVFPKMFEWPAHGMHTSNAFISHYEWQSSFHPCQLTHMRCVESGVQSGRYLAPMSRAFSLSSPLNGFWKPLSTNTTPSMIRLNGTCWAPSDFDFCCLGLASGLDWLSLFFSADFCAREAGETMQTFKEDCKCGNDLHAEIQTLT